MAGQQLFVLGDSHADAYGRTLAYAAAATGVRVIQHSKGGCAVASLIQPAAVEDADCQAFQRAVVDQTLADARPGDLVFLAALRVPRIADQDGLVDAANVAERLHGPLALARRDAAEREAEVLIARLQQAGLVVVMDLPLPVWRAPPFRCADAFNRMNPVCEPGFELDLDFQQQHRQAAVAALQRLARTRPGLWLWDPLPYFCDERICRAFDREGRPLFYDADHLSGHGNEVLAPAFVKLITAAAGSRPTPTDPLP